MNTNTHKRAAGWIIFIESILFNVKWLLLLFYLGLVLVMLLYAFSFVKAIIAVAVQAVSLPVAEMKIVALDFVDIVMVANLVKMIITGSYNSFVSKDHGRPNENISSGTLKIKISTSIIVVCAINLLRNFVADHTSWSDVQAKLWIFGSFLATTLVLGILEYLHVRGEAIEAQMKLSSE
jgi:uncharacterized protein (TIGR00645 family)